MYKNGDVYEFNDDIKYKKKNAGHFHFKIEFITSNPQSNSINTQKIKIIRLKFFQEEQAQKINQLEKDNSKLRSKLKKSNRSNNNQKGSNSDKLKAAESIWFYQNKSKNIDNCFVDDDEENFHKYIEKIGEGATSITYKIIGTRTNNIMCKKVLKVDQKKSTHDERCEKHHQKIRSSQSNHPCICTACYINTQETVKDANIDDSKNTTIAIFLEFLEFDLKKQLQNGMNNTLKTRIVVEISHALNYLHQKGMIHRDLKIE